MILCWCSGGTSRPSAAKRLNMSTTGSVSTELARTAPDGGIHNAGLIRQDGRVRDVDRPGDPAKSKLAREHHACHPQRRLAVFDAQARNGLRRRARGHVDDPNGRVPRGPDRRSIPSTIPGANVHGVVLFASRRGRCSSGPRRPGSAALLTRPTEPPRCPSQGGSPPPPRERPIPPRSPD